MSIFLLEGNDDDSVVDDVKFFLFSPKGFFGFTCSDSGMLNRDALCANLAFSSSVATDGETLTPNRSALFFNASSSSTDLATEETEPPNLAARACSAATGLLTTGTTFLTVGEVLSLGFCGEPGAVGRSTGADLMGLVVMDGVDGIDDIVDEPSVALTDDGDVICSPEISRMACSKKSVDVSAETAAIVESPPPAPSTSVNLATRSDFLALAGNVIPLSFSSFFKSVTCGNDRTQLE